MERLTHAEVVERAKGSPVLVHSDGAGGVALYFTDGAAARYRWLPMRAAGAVELARALLRAAERSEARGARKLLRRAGQRRAGGGGPLARIRGWLARIFGTAD